LSRSASLSEKELKEAKARSRRIAAQLTTAPGPSSKGRIDGLAGAGHGEGLPPRQVAMEEGEGQGMKPESDQPSATGEGLQENASLCWEPPAEVQQVPGEVPLEVPSEVPGKMPGEVPVSMPSEVPSEVPGEVPVKVPSKMPGKVPVSMPSKVPGEVPSKMPGEVPGEASGKAPNTPVGTATGTASQPSRQQNGTQGRQYYEVHLTLAKPKPVKNRTARPFGTQTSPTSGQPAEGSPAAELPPPPTYAETLSSPPPLTRVRSCGVTGPNPLPKTGILEESAARRASKKSMFTFVEKPKLGPNPDLLDLVQSVDSRKKQKEQGEPSAEDEPFALGAEAANFISNSTARSRQHLPTAFFFDAPAWSSCLKSPTIQPKPKPQPSHNLSEARGKGAELFARRQSRMEKFIIEAPSQPELLRSPSPTMSLPPSWKYDTNACLSPMVSRHLSKSPSRPSKTPPASLYSGNLMENEVSQKELEISKHQPYQLQSSLFILSPSKGPHHRGSAPDSRQPCWSWRPSRGAAVLLLASPCRLLPPRAKGGFQAPRPSYSTRNAGIEPQVWKPSFYYK
ncbi:PREDICTED: synaptopodin, partial [Mesitornis unicolor]|uniref:synaptopodin n=1 Tax=Mesitornis unicolor TaxID=54374 RepID=UPI00052816C3